MNYSKIINSLKEITKLGDIKKMAKEIKTDHDMALKFLNDPSFHKHLLSVLIMDKKQIDEALLITLAKDMKTHTEKEQNQIIDWLLANQLMKSKNLIEMMNTWQNHELPMFRRLFWYYEARLRWTGKTEYDNTEVLLTTIEKEIMNEVPQVQWAMNYLTAQIGIYVPELRQRCIAIGETTGLYEGEKVSKGCTPNYLPDFISIEVKKREKL